MVPHKTPAIIQKLMPSRLWRVEGAENKLFLTFDDGPIPGLTEWVLDLLKEKGAKATFFCVGSNIKKHPKLFERILSEGHQVGNHTQDHLNGWETPLGLYLKNIEECKLAMDGLQGNTNLFRPPYGKLKWQQKKRLNDYKIVMWDVLSKDYLQSLPKENVLAETIKATESGSIIVFHDNLKAEQNLKFTLPRFIDHFCALGFQFEKL